MAGPVKESLKTISAFEKGEIIMKKSDCIRQYRANLAETMQEKYRSVLNSDGEIQYKVYLWDDGTIESLEGPQGDNSFLQARSGETRELFYVCTISAPFLDLWDYCDHSAPEELEERERDRQEIIDFLVQEYASDIVEILDSVILEEDQREEESAWMI